MSELLSFLNEEQQKAVLTIDKPLLVLAGAGSGKTRVLVYRIAYLIEVGISPWNITAVTFTNKAAGEMKGRIKSMVGARADNINIGTFHSICLKILRRNCGRIGFERNFVIYDTSDQLTLMKDLIKEQNIDPKQFVPREVLSEIEHAKTYNISPEDYSKYRDISSSYFFKVVDNLYREFNKTLKERNAMDFNDILINGLNILIENPDILDYYQDKFKYIHVDEYQDTNEVQYRIVKLLSDKYRNICAVGDEDQAIYGWRGADIKNILNFEKDFPDYEEIRLERNYRSTSKILQAASEMIKNNRTSKGKYLKTHNEEGENLTCYHAQDAYDEAHYIAGNIASLIAKGVKYSDIAVFYRVNWLSRVFETVLREYGIPHRIIGGFRFYERKEIKEIMAYIRLVVNNSDDAAFERIINVPKRGIGKNTIIKIKNASRANNISMYEAVSRPDNFGRASKKLFKAYNLLSGLKKKAGELTPTAFVENVIKDSQIIDYYLEQEGGENRIENIKEFISAVREFETSNPESTIEDFMQMISLYSDSDEEFQDGEVLLMTLHNAKGLEFPYVFISGLEEEILPHSRSLETENELEEERRLFYVGITRGMKKLYLTFTYTRHIFGNIKYSRPSRFLSELPEKLIEF
ncbi:MAG: ATP-dependent helicase [Candidatus Muiribacteriota bacterium]